VKAVDEAAGKGIAGEEIFAQTGGGAYRPRNMKYVEKLERGEFAEYVAKASALIGHAGMGTILVAVEAGKPLLVMPRQAEFGEIVNDHQVATAAKFAALGQVIVARDEGEIEARIAELRSFRPRARIAHPEGVVERVKGFLRGLEEGRS
jgi:UDP-N-acetylglucosamine transferase subunit ALG13